MIQQPGVHLFDSDLQNLFNLKQHLQEFLNLDAETLDLKLKIGMQQMAELGHKDFDWEEATTFYRERVKELYLFDLGAWHLSIHEGLGNMLMLIADNAQGQVLDFGGGIGTHAIGAALCPEVKQVTYCDINPINLDFVHYRAKKLGLCEKIRFCSEIPEQESFDTILCFDVLEHLPDPSQQLLQFHEILTPKGKIIVNWFFYKGKNNEHPFHLDDPQAIDTFFRTLQSRFVEIFHAYNTSARCYRQWI
ncbi:class I SAM-dependent methyltransferase [Nostoc commune]|uniref:class I SAM-dependent methyltransferase n=1 Tax=Nostoc commune TaxID=1178 RepID=UPI0018C71548|nr:class I SAM-dependent methyltransferase [Nostoc commune]MBG1260934.1 class I SAM-dependent methyltransferase [Nostoc commune BAE]